MARVSTRVLAIVGLTTFSLVGQARAATTGALEVPPDGGFVGGLGVASGWVCDADLVEIEFDGKYRMRAAYGTDRDDTRTKCADKNNGFSLLYNWPLLGEGEHTAVAYADGMEFGSAVFHVTTLGDGTFLRDMAGSCLVEDFNGRDVLLEWQEASQSFVPTATADTGPAPPIREPKAGYYKGRNSADRGCANIVHESDVCEVRLNISGDRTALTPSRKVDFDTQDRCGDAGGMDALSFMIVAPCDQPSEFATSTYGWCDDLPLINGEFDILFERGDDEPPSFVTGVCDGSSCGGTLSRQFDPECTHPEIFWSASLVRGGGPSPTVTPSPTRTPSPTYTPRRTPRPTSRPCCKICTTGKACGNSCISRSYTCHQPRGCACNG